MGMGGGIIRDLLLNVEPATLQSNWYLLTAVGAALVGMLLANIFERLNAVIVALDAVVIGLFGAFGTSKRWRSAFPGARGVRRRLRGGGRRHPARRDHGAAGGDHARRIAVRGRGRGRAARCSRSRTPRCAARGRGDRLGRGHDRDPLLAVIFDISLPEQRALYRRKVAVETSAIPIIRASKAFRRSDESKRRQTAASERRRSRVRIARLTQETIALSDAVEMSPSMPTPHSRSPSTCSSTYDAACASPPALSVCST
jgi:hypothetical protein